MSRCRSCGEPIRWVKTVNDKSMPLDVEPHPEGNITVEAGVAHVFATTPPRVDDRTPVYRSHFVTCPNATSHRNQRKDTP